jgi:hypothetical protein
MFVSLLARKRHILFACCTLIGVYLLSFRAKFILTCVLLLVALFCVVLSAKSTMQTVQKFRQENAMARSGDVRTVDQWMTIPFIAHTYHVPESYLYAQLHLSNSRTLQRMTLQVLAMGDNRPVSHLISEVQRAILMYRQLHPATFVPASILILYMNGQLGRNAQ